MHSWNERTILGSLNLYSYEKLMNGNAKFTYGEVKYLIATQMEKIVRRLIEPITPFAIRADSMSRIQSYSAVLTSAYKCLSLFAPQFQVILFPRRNKTSMRQAWKITTPLSTAKFH